MNFYSKLIGLAGLASLSAMVSATPLSDYNLILFGDVNATSNLKVYGKAIIGGSLNSSGEFGSELKDAAFNATNNVEVVGNVASPTLTIQNGYLGYGGSASISSLNCNENGIPMPQGACVRVLDDVSATTAKLNDFYNVLSDDSDFYLSHTQVGSVNGNQLSGFAADLVVFNIAGSDLFANNSNWSLDFGGAAKVVINVSGTNLSNPGSVNLNGGGFDQYSNILWNFHQATSLNLGSGWKGSVMALDAHVRTANDFDGSLAAKSYTGAGQIHHYYWDYTPPAKEVPESGSLALLLSGLCLLGLTRLRRRT